MPEVRRLVLAMAELEEEKRTFRLGWSAWRRAHQAVAARYRKASRAAKRALSGEAAVEDRAGPSTTTLLCAEGAPLTDEEWEHVEPLLPHKPPAGRRYHDHRRVLGRHPVGGAHQLLLAGDAGRVRQVGDRLPALRVVVKAGSLAALPRSVGRRSVAGTGD